MRALRCGWRLALIGALLSLLGCSLPFELSQAQPSPQADYTATTSPFQPAPTATQTPIPPSATPAPPTDTPTATATATSVYHFCQPEVDVFHVEFPLARPIPAEGIDSVDPSYRYGATAGGLYEPHAGVEFVNPSGVPVLAVADGVVLRAGTDDLQRAGPYLNFYGMLVVLQHDIPNLDQPLYSLYGHLSQVDVREGDRVSVGEQVGEVGATGIALGSHLHFEVRLGQNTYASTVNPELWLAPRLDNNDQAFGVLAGYVLGASGQFLRNERIKIDFQPAQGQEDIRNIFVEPYASDLMNPHPTWGENFAVNDLPAGVYKVSVVAGTLLERTVEIRPGQLTVVAFCQAGE